MNLRPMLSTLMHDFSRACRLYWRGGRTTLSRQTCSSRQKHTTSRRMCSRCSTWTYTCICARAPCPASRLSRQHRHRCHHLVHHLVHHFFHPSRYILRCQILNLWLYLRWTVARMTWTTWLFLSWSSSNYSYPYHQWQRLPSYMFGSNRGGRSLHKFYVRSSFVAVF